MSKQQKRWEFVPGDEIVIAPGRTVKRIRALVAISALGVMPGDTGGYVEREDNLEQVSGNAWVYGDAWVSGNAQVSGNARVYGNAWVSGDARVYGDGLVVWFSGVGSENGTLTVYNAKYNTIEVTRGCFHGTPQQFLDASARKHDARIQLEYKMLIEVGISRIEAARAAIKEPA